MKFLIIILFLSGILFFNSCDILRLSRFEVISWTPNTGFHSDPEKIVVSLKFSGTPDKMSVERNFSLTGDGGRITGKYHWNGKILIFSPLTYLDVNTDYIINLSADAHDVNGLSMDEDFYGKFSTRPDSTRPVLISCCPGMYEDVINSRREIKLEFSAPVSSRTLYENVSFNPSMTGLWKLSENGKSAVFTPSEPWAKNSRYEIRLSSSLTDNNGMNIREGFTSIFTTGTETDKPYLLNVMRLTKNENLILLSRDNGYAGAGQIIFENQGWEKDDKFILIFSCPVDSSSVKNFVNADDAPGIFMETSAGFNKEFIFRFENPPEFRSRFTLKIKPGIKDEKGNESKNEYIYKIFANGKYSKPPELTGIRIPMSPDNEQDKKLKFYWINSLYEIIPITDENYPSGESINTWIELYFDTAEDAEIDLFSVMENFRIETSNNVITFSARHVKDKSFTAAAAHPGTEKYKRIEVNGNLTNSTFFGIINFQINAGLKDSFGNINDKLQKISLIK